MLFKTRTQIYCLVFIFTITLRCQSDSAPEILRDPSFLQLLNKHYTGIQPTKRQLPARASDAIPFRFRTQDESPYQFPSSSATSANGYSYQQDTKSQQLQSHQRQPHTGSATGVDQSDWKQSYSYPSSSLGYWDQKSNASMGYNEAYNQAYDHAYNPSYMRPTSSAGTYNRGNYDNMQGSYSMMQYQQLRPMTYNPVKKTPINYNKNKIVKISDGTNIKYKKTSPPTGYYSSTNNYKKTIYPRIHTPYVGHKYPIKKVAGGLHPYYKRYYQYQYPYYYYSPSNDLTRSKIKKIPVQSESYYNMGPTSSPEIKIQLPKTTVKTEENYSERPIDIEDYNNYNDTHHKSNKGNNYTNYYETSEEAEEPITEGHSAYGYEATTRGYYGDRVYMSTQVPAPSPEKKPTKNRFYVVRSEAPGNEDDIETIFE